MPTFYEHFLQALQRFLLKRQDGSGFHTTRDRANQLNAIACLLCSHRRDGRQLIRCHLCLCFYLPSSKSQVPVSSIVHRHVYSSGKLKVSCRPLPISTFPLAIQGELCPYMSTCATTQPLSRPFVAVCQTCASSSLQRHNHEPNSRSFCKCAAPTYHRSYIHRYMRIRALQSYTIVSLRSCNFFLRRAREIA